MLASVRVSCGPGVLFFLFFHFNSGRGDETGIAKRSYPGVDIRNLTRAQAVDIYRRDFWQRVRGDELPREVAFQALDAAVNHGIGNAVRWMQRAAGVADDGVIGPVTLAAVQRAQPADLVLRSP